MCITKFYIVLKLVSVLIYILQHYYITVLAYLRFFILQFEHSYKIVLSTGCKIKVSKCRRLIKEYELNKYFAKGSDSYIKLIQLILADL